MIAGAKAAAIAVLIALALYGRPPVHLVSARPQPVQSVVTSSDEMQDRDIRELQEFRTNQENWNKETGKQIQELTNLQHELLEWQRELTNRWLLVLGIFNVAGVLYPILARWNQRNRETHGND